MNTFLDKELRAFFKVRDKHQEIQQKRDRRFYGKLYRLCKKHGVTWTREDSYWDFSAPIGTVGLNEGVSDYESAFEYVDEKIFEIQCKKMDDEINAVLDDIEIREIRSAERATDSNFDRETV